MSADATEVDYLIIGAGMAGTVLQRFLHNDQTVVLDPRPGAYKVGESIIPEHFHHPVIRELVPQAKTLPSYCQKTGITFISKNSVASFPLPMHGSQVAMHVERSQLEQLMHREWKTPIVRERVQDIDLDSMIVTTDQRRYHVRNQILDCSGPAMVVARKCGEVTDLWPTFARWAYFDVESVDDELFWQHIRARDMKYSRFDVPNGQLLQAEEDPDWKPSKNTIITQVSQSVWTWQIPLYGHRVLSFGVVSRSDRIGEAELYELAEKYHAPQYRLKRRARGPDPLDRLHTRGRYARRATTPATDKYILIADACAFGDPLYSVGTGIAVNKAIEVAAILNEEGWTAETCARYNQDTNRMTDRSHEAFELWYRGELLSSPDSAREVRQNYLVGTAFQVGIANHYSRVLDDAGAPARDSGPDGRGRHQVDPAAPPVTDEVRTLLGLEGDRVLEGWTLEGAYRTPTEIQHRWSHPDKPEFVINTSFDPGVTRYYLQVQGISLSFMNLWDGPYPFDECCVQLMRQIEARIVERPEEWRALDPTER
jgi:flavin-dependent dehydrogenase